MPGRSTSPSGHSLALGDVAQLVACLHLASGQSCCCIVLVGGFVGQGANARAVAEDAPDQALAGHLKSLLGHRFDGPG